MGIALLRITLLCPPRATLLMIRTLEYMFFYILLIALVLSPPCVTVDGSTVSLIALKDGSLVHISGYYENGTRITNVGTFTVVKNGTFYIIKYEGNRSGTWYLKVSADYERFLVRHMGCDRDVVYDMGNKVLFIHAKFELSSNGSFVRFDAGEFEIHVGVYYKGSPSYPLLIASIFVFALGFISKLFPNKDR